MYVINTDTNAFIGSYALPPGSFELPFHGFIQIVTSGGNQTNFTVGGGDTVIIWNGGAAVETGVEPWEMFLLGVWLVVSVHGLLAFARRIARHLSGGAVREV